MKIRIALLALAGAVCVGAQKPGQVRWTLTLEPNAAPPGGKVLGRLSAEIDSGWHLYSFSTPAATPITIRLPEGSPLASFRVFQPPPRRSLDLNFNSETETYEGKVDFLIEGKLRDNLQAGAAEVTFNLRYQTCSDKLCVPGKSSVTAGGLKTDTSAADFTPRIPHGYSAVQPVFADIRDTVAKSNKAVPQDLASFLLIAFGFGLASIFTPCVFPMIPVTMSYFLNRQSGNRRESVLQAAVFCLGIVFLFTVMGSAITAVLGPFGVVQLSANPWVNGLIATLFIAFGFSLLGAFELSIPSSILTKLDQGAGRGGYAGSLLMGLTFSLTSFACVGPFVGTLLAASVQGGGAQPIMGMVTFAAGLALPFFLLALFPSYLKRMPRSGGWLVRVKMVMGFVILAVSLKYLGSVDQVLQWGFLTRERFLAAWVVLFALPGLYLLGFLRLEGIKADQPLGTGRLLTGSAFLIFSISLLPGMFGGRLGDLDAFVPLATPGSNSGGSAASPGGLVWLKNQYREALAQAKREGKLVFVNFTGYTCTNCHWMKANMFPRPEIAAALGQYILVELYTDGNDEAAKVNEELQLAKFNTASVPLYVILDADEKVIATSAGLTRDPREYLAFLQKGIRAPAAPAAPVAASADAGIPQGLSRLDGGAVDGLDGKVVVVNFWATWCVPCIQEIPSFNKLHHEYGAKGVTVLGVSMDEDGPEKVKRFLARHPMQYGVAMGTETVNQQFKLDQLPVTVVFDRSGRQVQRFEGFTREADLRAAVERSL